ncbi:MAG: hypothetical protein ABIU29_11655, partial [Chthoniobacterales bacterium]
MQKKHVAETGSFNPRIFLAFLLCAAGSWLAVLSFAATPGSGTLSEATPVLNYTAGPFFQSNPVPVPVVEANPTCNGTTNPCDSYNLTISVGAAYLSANPNAAAKVTVSWTDTGSGNSDYDLYVYSGTVGNTTDSTPVLTRSASGANPEVATIFPLQDGPYTIKVVPYTATGETIDARIELIADATGGGGGGGGGGPFGGADPTVPGNPRYQNFYAPSGSSAEAGSGEFNIGFNPATGRIMTMNNGPIWRLTPPEIAVPPFRPDPLPECCEALWQDRSSTVTDAGVDPILWTDQPTGRTFASNSTAGANALYAYSDSDGEPSMTQPTGWTPFGVGIVSGADHQTIGSGPFPLSVFNPFPALNLGEYVLYCSQTLVGALCSRSEDLGVSYLTGQVATGPGALNSQGCGGLHGHVHVAPDGTAWLPDKSCGTKQGGGISTDASTLPWSEFTVEKLVPDANGPAFTTSAQANGADPSIAIDSASTVYYCYVNNEASGTEGHARVAVGKRVANSTAVNWIRDFDIGASHGIKNAAHPEAVGGTTGRAACGFIGTDKPGDYQSGTFPGKWYAFIATTYDEGVTWVTVNATPNDPVQSMTGIWQQGGSGENGNRNLLDFNEITVDDKGRVLYGYSDGCVTPACIDGSAGNDKTAYMRVARQSG